MMVDSESSGPNAVSFKGMRNVWHVRWRILADASAALIEPTPPFREARRTDDQIR